MAFLQITPDMTAGEVLVGTGTLALAGFTGWLARRTSAEVEISEEQMRLSRESIEALDRPFVIPKRHSGINRIPIGEGFIVFRMENLGKGPALVEDIQLIGDPWNEYLDNALEGRVFAISPGDGTNVRLPLIGDEPPEGAVLGLRIFYRSASAAEYVTQSTLEVLTHSLCEFVGHYREHDAAY